VISPIDLRLVAGTDAHWATVTGTLQETPTVRASDVAGERTFRNAARVTVQSVILDGTTLPARGDVIVNTPGVLSPNYFGGQRVRISGVLAPPRPPVARELFDPVAHFARQGVYHQLKVESPGDWALLSSNRPPFTDRFIAWASQTLARGLPIEDEALRLNWAMVLGWRTALTTDVSTPFMRSGTMHIFAISGLHIALIAGILVAVLRAVRVPRIVCGIVVIPLLWFYTAATGWQSSAIRSTVMMTVILGGWALNRPSDLINSLAAAGLVILLWQPQQLFQPSFQLSFFVVLTIALVMPRLEKFRDRLLQTDPFLPRELLPRWRRWLEVPLHWLTTMTATSVAAWLGALPLTAYYFHLISPVTLLANVVVVPLSTLAPASALGSLAGGAWCPPLTELLNHSAGRWM
jgi:ComEC/Rec2-related protein